MCRLMDWANPTEESPAYRVALKDERTEKQFYLQCNKWQLNKSTAGPGRPL